MSVAPSSTTGQRAATCGRRSTVHGMPYSDDMPRLDHVELQAADDADDRMAGAVDRHEHLQQPFFRELQHRFVESLVPHFAGPQDRELLGRELRDRRKLQPPCPA